MGEISLKQLVASPIQAAVAASQRLRPARQDDPGWKACMRILPDTRQERGQKRRASHKGLQLFRILECSQLMHAMEANVAWYTGGLEAVTLPEEDEEAAPGVYTGNSHPLQDRVADEEDAGPQTPVAGITKLQWLGTARDFIKFTEESRSDLGEQRYADLMEMLQAGPHESSDADSQ
jgi:hypothetical protein